MHAEKTNRLVLLLLGLLLLAAGVLGALAGFGAFGDRAKNQALIDNPVGRFFGTQGRWLWPAIAVLAVIIGLAALRWLWTVLFSTDRVAAVHIRRAEGARGRTTLAAGALTDAVTDEVSGYRGVQRASARLVGTRSAPTLVISATLDRSADPSRVRARVEREAAGHARNALDTPDLPVQLDLGVTDAAGQRVR